MKFFYLKRTVYFLIPIVYLILGIYGYHLLNNTKFKLIPDTTPENIGAVIILILILFTYIRTIKYVFDLDFAKEQKHGLNFLFFCFIAYVSVGLYLNHLNILPDWYNSLIILESALLITTWSMTALTYDVLVAKFNNKIWKQFNESKIWVFNANNILQIIEEGMDVTEYKWDYNFVTKTLTTRNNNKTNVFMVLTNESTMLELKSISSNDILKFSRVII